MERRCLKHMITSRGMGGFRWFPSSRRYLMQQSKYLMQHRDWCCFYVFFCYFFFFIVFKLPEMYTIECNVKCKGLTLTQETYLSLGTRFSSVSSACRLTGQIWVPLMSVMKFNYRYCYLLAFQQKPVAHIHDKKLFTISWFFATLKKVLFSCQTRLSLSVKPALNKMFNKTTCLGKTDANLAYAE